MHIINRLIDIQELEGRRAITAPLARHLEKKVKLIKTALEPDTRLYDFTLNQSGSIGILEIHEKDMSELGIPETLAKIMPEWIGCINIEAEVYYVVYVMTNNDYIVQLYLPENILDEPLRTWLSEQSIEEEGADDYEI